MSFAMKYDKDGRPTGLAETAAEIQRPTIDQAAVYAQPAEALEDLPVVEAEQQEAVDQLQQEVAAAEQKAMEEKVQAENIARQAAQESFRAVREKAERMEKERNEYMRMLEEEKLRKVENDIELGDDDLVEAKHFKKYQKELQNIKRETEQARKQAYETTTELKLKSQFPDFDKVVSDKTITALNNAYPELAHSLSTNSDIYSKAVSAYTMIKNLGLYKEDTFMADKNQAQKNAAKPKPVASIATHKGNSPLSQANNFELGLTPDLMKQYRAEMEAARKLY